MLLVLLISVLLVSVVSGSSSSFKDKTNKDLHCRLGNKEKLKELSITPGKHIYNDAAGDTYVYNGASIEVRCINPKETFANGVVKIVGDRNDYKLYKYTVVQCMYSTVIVPDIFSVEKFCAPGCPDPDLSATHYKIDPEKNGEDEEDKAPFDEQEYTVTCRNGYVRAYKDDGDNTFTCKDSKFDKTQAQLVTCAPGCKDLANDILPYRRALAIVPYKSSSKISTPLNMVWPGAPYPHGAKLYFDCYGGSANSVSSSGPLYCYTNEDGEACDSCTEELGWWDKKVPACKWKSADL